ncbi:MAG: Gfo/Idh/MocA family oxidoreductase [Planctomycetota bacterium]
MTRSAAAASAFAAPYFVPANVLAGPGRVGANDRVGLAVVGVGLRGGQLIRNVPESGRVVALCDADLRKTAAVLKRHAADWPVEQDYRRLLERTDLDGVIIATPDHHHVQAAMLACGAGLDVYLEKPASLYICEGRALVSAARRCQRIVQVGTQQRSMELNRFACEFVRGGGIGPVRVVQCVNYPSPRRYRAGELPAAAIPAGLDWDLWQGPAPRRSYHPWLASLRSAQSKTGWVDWWAYSGGGVTGLGSHAFDMVQYALGADDSGPVEFWPAEDDDAFGASTPVHFRYASGTEVRMHFANERPFRGPRLGAVFVGARGKIEINRNKFTTNPPDLVTDPPDPSLARKWEGDGWVALGHVQNWIDCIKTRQRPVADVEIGHRSVTIAHLVNVTRQLGRRVRWDPVGEVCPGDDEANRLLDRPRHPGWELPKV